MTSVLSLSPYLLPLLLLVAALVAGLAWRVLGRRASRQAPPARHAPARTSRRPSTAGPLPADDPLTRSDEGPEVAEVTPSGWPLTMVAPPEPPADDPRAAPVAPTPPPAAPIPVTLPHAAAPAPAAEAAPATAAWPSPPAGPSLSPRPGPVAVPPAMAAPGAGEPASPLPAPVTLRRAALPILLVDDSPTVRAALRRCLRAGGHDVLQAGNGQEALSVLHRQRCGLLITDLEMPVMDGVGLLRQLQAVGLLEHLPVLAISGHEHASRSLPPDLPIDGVFRKPWSDAELLQRVAELMALPHDTALRA
ncbi:MAG: hypothetical protein RLY78_662 [Pseudomonadota bacterium]